MCALPTPTNTVCDGVGGFDNQENELRDLLAAHWNRLADTYCDKSGVNVMIGHLMFAENGGPVVQEPDDEILFFI